MTLNAAPHDEPSTLQHGQVAELWIYPIKSCAGMRVPQVRLEATGLRLDRHWMVVDGAGRFITQRTHPQMALIATDLSDERLLVHAMHKEDMPLMGIALQANHECEEVGVLPSFGRKVRVWGDEVQAWDEGDAVAEWFSEALGSPVRLVRFDEGTQRLCSADWTKPGQAHTQFADGFPLLITTDTSVDALNQRLQAQGDQPVDMRRFRANVVLSGFAAHAEDRMQSLELLGTALGPDGQPKPRPAPEPLAVLRPVKPCTRCPMPDVNPDTAEQGSSVRQALKTYRRDPALNQAITFGQNAIVLRGEGAMLYEGMTVRAQMVPAA